jgi:hypothetical protein
MVFCDWLSIYQVHFTAGVVPLVNDGHVFSVDQDGEIKWDVPQKLLHRGSHETSIRIRSDGNRVSLEGNIGRFNRPDNLFGYTVAECIKLANRLLEQFGLPPFTDAKPMALVSKGGVDGGYQATAAVITRVDLTCNWATGSPGNVEQFIRHLQGFKSGRQEPTTYKTTGVAWGVGSKYWYAKVYDKAGEYYRQCGKKAKAFDPLLFEYMSTSGIARHEIELKSRYMKQNNLWRISQWGNGMEDRIYALFNDVIGGQTHVDSFLEIEGRAGELAVAWRDGADLKKRLSTATYYRYRKQLLKYNIDIAVPSNVKRLQTRVEVVTLSPAEMPSWYVLPKVA